MGDGMSSSDRAIKKSAEQEPEYTPRPSAQRLPDGELKLSVINKCKNVKAGYTHVHVIDYPSFDASFDWYRVNFYYSQDVDPTTRIDSYVIQKDSIQ